VLLVVTWTSSAALPPAKPDPVGGTRPPGCCHEVFVADGVAYCRTGLVADRSYRGYCVIEAPSGQWDGELIADGIAALERARGGPRGPLLLQAILERTT
jgi:hypothetical protein